jgi:hypothetical protein
MKRFVLTMAMALAGAALTVHAQNPGGAPTPAKAPEEGGGARGRAGHSPQSPEKVAEELMKKFDADQDGKLSQPELTQALESIEHHHPRVPGGHGARRARGQGSSGAQSGLDTPGSSDAQSSADSQSASDTSTAPGGNRARPSSDQIAARLIEKFSSDKTGLTAPELAKAIREHRASHALGESRQTGAQPTAPGAPQ